MHACGVEYAGVIVLLFCIGAIDSVPILVCTLVFALVLTIAPAPNTVLALVVIGSSEASCGKGNKKLGSCG